MALSLKMKQAIKLFVKHTGNRNGFMEAAKAVGFSHCGAATYWHVLHKCPTPSQKFGILVEKRAQRGALTA